MHEGLSIPNFAPKILFFAKVSIFFSSNFFIATATFLDSGIVGLTENLLHVIVLLRRSVRKTHFIRGKYENSLWSKPLNLLLLAKNGVFSYKKLRHGYH